ncbi:MAG: hypothetical protein ACLFTQ_03790 [Candidatus Aenigmatarchaeota archaeon]
MGDVFDTNWKRYVAAIIGTLLVFGFGVGLGYTFVVSTTEDIHQAQNDLERQIISANLQKDLAAEHICNADIFGITEGRTILGRKLTQMEQSFGSEDERVVSMKRRYSLLSLQQMLLVEEYNERCNDSYAPILFFYSNQRNVSDSEAQGYVLNYVYENYQDEVVTYSLDFDLNEPALKTLKGIHGVDRVPSLVVNGTTYKGLRDREEVEGILTNQTHLNITGGTNSTSGGSNAS